LDVECAVDLAQPLHEVVREGVVVVDDEDHGTVQRSEASGCLQIFKV
jgi:hypothetical protein